jgi:hypothetical protein
VFVVGAGKRVRETALPALVSLPGAFEIAAVLARSARDLAAAGRRFPVRALDEGLAQEVAPGDLVYVAVGKDAVPAVLERLAVLDRARLELLVDTPVLRWKHLRHLERLEGWARVSVAEDTAYLPWYAAARAAAGSVESVLFDRSAYAYHGLAQAKALCGAARILRARRGAQRELLLSGGARATIVEPRDYAVGRVVLTGSRGRVADRLEPGESGIRLEPLLEGDWCTGFRAGDVVTRLAPEEAALTGGCDPAATITARMDSMKRVGFRRLLESIAAGKGANPLADGLDDMGVDWFLERFGRWRPTALTDVRSALARRVWGILGRFA